MIQVTKCPCGKIFAACREPECYTEADYQRDTRKYIAKGCTVEMVENGTWKFEQCTCQNMKPVVSDDSQTSLFS
jgi:DTW domain-containing protein YfiP